MRAKALNRGVCLAPTNNPIHVLNMAGECLFLLWVGTFSLVLATSHQGSVLLSFGEPFAQEIKGEGG